MEQKFNPISLGRKTVKGRRSHQLYRGTLGVHCVRYIVAPQFINNAWIWRLRRNIGYNGRWDETRTFEDASTDRRKIKNLMHTNLRALRQDAGYY